MSTRFFAYGTLRQGQAPEEIALAVARLVPLGRGMARGRRFDLGAYPGAVFSDASGDVVEGEMYEVPDDGLWMDLDAYEGFDPNDRVGSLFVRKQVTVRIMESEEEVLCWAYEYNRTG